MGLRLICWAYRVQIAGECKNYSSGEKTRKGEGSSEVRIQSERITKRLDDTRMIFALGNFVLYDIFFKFPSRSHRLSSKGSQRAKPKGLRL